MSSLTSFFKLTADELQQAYQAKEITASRYILWIIKTHGKACWKWSFNVIDFCREWFINERTFYRAIAKLKSLGLIQWEKKEVVSQKVKEMVGLCRKNCIRTNDYPK